MQDELPSLEDIGRSMTAMEAEVAAEEAAEVLTASRPTSVALDSPPGSPGAHVAIRCRSWL